MSKIDVAIIGAGVAGLSAAVACCKAGIDAHVFETAPEFSPLGTSLSLWPNAMRCLAEWGLDADVTACGKVIEQIAWRRPNGKPYFVYPLRPIYEQLGYSGVCVRRSDLHKHLLAAIPKHRLHTNRYLVAANDTEDDGVKLQFENGHTQTAGHVIAADGLWSQLRKTILDDGDPIYSGYGAWFGLSPVKAPGFGQNEGCEFIGATARLGVFETGRNTRYWFLIANRDVPNKHASSVPIDEILPYLAGWPEELREIVLGTSSRQAIYSSFYERPVSAQWGRGNITLVGDAMHPIVPNLGQGACQAIEDGHTVAAGLSQGLRGASLNSWVRAQRLTRIRYMRRTANRIGNLVQSSTRMSRWVIPLLGLPPLRQLSLSDLKKQFSYMTPDG